MEEAKIRVLIANPTRLVRDVLYETIREQDGIEVVGDVSEEEAILSAVERTDPDCVIVPLDKPGVPTPICAEILAERPCVKIVAIGEGTNVIALYWKCTNGETRCTYSTASRRSILRALYFAAS